MSNKGARRAIVVGSLLGGLLASTLLSGCGIPGNTTAQPLTSVQLGLLAGAPQTASSTPKPGSKAIEVYFIRNGDVYPVKRYIGSQTLSLTAEASQALDALDAGPSAAELSQGITTSLYEIPQPTLRIVSIDITNHLVHVGLDDEFIPPNLFGTRLAQAYAEIVFTLTSSVFSGQIRSLKFALHGGVWPAYLPNGFSGNSVSQSDYSSFVPKPAHATTRQVITHHGLD